MEEKRFGVGVIGSGWVSKEHVDAFRNNPHCEVRALASRTRAGAEKLRERCGLDRGLCSIHDTWRKLVEDESVDIVSICSTPDVHAEQTIAAAQAGKHVCIEKAVALDLKQLRAMQGAVHKAKVRTVVCFELRWNLLFLTIRRLMDRKAIGDVYLAEVDYMHGIGPWYKQYEWNVKKSVGRSSLLSAGCHAVDALRHFTGKEAAEVVAFSTRNKGRIWDRYEYDPTCALLVRFQDGSIGKTSSTIDCVSPYQFTIRLMGSEGCIRDNLIWSKKMFPGQTSWVQVPTILPDSGDVTHHPYEGQIDDFVDCILSGRESHLNLDDAARTHEICFAGDMSAARGGRPVKLPLK